MLSKVYTPGKIGTLELRNRLIMTAMHTAYCTEGIMSDMMVEFYRRRARGGVGLIVVGAAGVDPTRLNHHAMLRLSDDCYIPGLRKLTDAVHAEGAAIFPQLMHAGRYARSKEYDGQQAVAPSAVPSRFTGETPRELAYEEIQDLVRYFGEAAGRAKAAGFDGIEVTAASGYLLAQFLSAATNQRTDRYGGDLSQRLTFPLEVIASIKTAVGPEFPLMVRVAGSDFVPGGNTWNEVVEICKAFEKAGVDAIDVTGGWHETGVPQLTMEVPQGAFAYLGRKIREAVAIPVAMCNRMNAEMAEKLIDDGMADFIGMARELLADPNLPEKAVKGDYSLIRPCIACNQACMDHIFFGSQLNCLVNAEAGKEAELLKAGELASENKASQLLKILVIGAGPAGLEYARVASGRGHSVTIWEQSKQAGGQALAAAMVDGRREFAKFTKYLVAACEKNNVNICFNKKAVAAEILAAVQSGDFDRVVVATGKKSAVLNIETDGSVPVVNYIDAITGNAAVGKSVVVAGGANIGVQAAMKLSETGTIDSDTLRFLMRFKAESPEELNKLANHGLREIVIVEEGKGIGKDIGPSTRWSAMIELKQAGIVTKEQTKVVLIKDGIVTAEGPEGVVELPADTLVMAIAGMPENTLFNELDGKISEISVIGDARGQGNLLSAVRNAYKEASLV